MSQQCATLLPASSSRLEVSSSSRARVVPMSRADHSFIREVSGLLTRHERMVTMLRYTEELTCEEVAQVLRVSVREIEDTLRAVRQVIVDARSALPV